MILFLNCCALKVYGAVARTDFVHCRTSVDTITPKLDNNKCDKMLFTGKCGNAKTKVSCITIDVLTYDLTEHYLYRSV